MASPRRSTFLLADRRPKARGWQATLSALALTLSATVAPAQQPTPPLTVPPVTRLQRPEPVSPHAAETARPAATESAASALPAPRANAPQPETTVPQAEPSDFERLARDANGGRPVWRLGSRSRRADGSLAFLETPARVPTHYVLQVGDEVTVTLWGSVDAHWQQRVDRAGRLTLPRVGPVPVAGATANELAAQLRSRLDRVFKGYELAAAVTDVTPVRIHITGFVDRPGDYVVPGLTTISSALSLVQGPSAGGSFRRIQLLRDGATVVEFDLYNLLRGGSRRDDRMLQPGDVLYVHAAGPQAAVLGSVNRAAVFEFMPGETVADVLLLAGGFSPVADQGTLTVERLRDRSSLGAVELALPRDARTPLSDGDILRVKSRVAAGVPALSKNKRVLVEGEVRQPGEYLLPPAATLADAIEAAGGATPAAFVFGAALKRESVRITQETNYERALQELETDLARKAAQRAAGDERSSDADATIRQALQRLRSRRPEGRVVLDVTPQSTQLPPIELEDGDQLTLPPANQSVGVFGSVFHTGSFLHGGNRNLGHYIQRAGGPTGGADYDAAFVVRANGSVLSAAQGGGWRRTRQFEEQPALPGDTVFVPEELFRVSWTQGAKDWTQILYQLGVGLAALRTLR